MDLTSRYFSTRATSKVSSGTPPCSNTDVGSSCQDKGSRLRGANSDFDNPIGNQVGPAGCDKEADADVLRDCPVNIPAMPAVPATIILEIGTWERWLNTCPRVSSLREKVLMLFE